MKYYSTKNNKTRVSFKTALFQGLAPDAGLYMPESLPNLTALIQNLSKKKTSLNDIACEVLSEFVDIEAQELKNITDETFNFSAPLVKLNNDLFVLELFHGPTLSFKDFGARFMARAMNHYLQGSGEKLNIVVATSGDTGSAVAAGFYGLPNTKVFVLYPKGRVSELQEKQIATFGGNVEALSVEGDFDDCQRLAKSALSDNELREKVNLSSANSINIGRLLPQSVYYFWACSEPIKMGETRKPIVVVPSGNFGNLTAGLFARRMGLPAKKFVAAVNINSGIPEFLRTGNLRVNKTIATASSAMDVGNPSNWARIMDLYGMSPIGQINSIGPIEPMGPVSPIVESVREKISKDLEAITITEEETQKTIKEIQDKFGYLPDPHTAVGIAAAEKSGHSPCIVLSTAHPAKFLNTPLPPELKEVLNKQKQSTSISREYSDFRNLLEEKALA